MSGHETMDPDATSMCNYIREEILRLHSIMSAFILSLVCIDDYVIHEYLDWIYVDSLIARLSCSQYKQLYL